MVPWLFALQPKPMDSAHHLFPIHHINDIAPGKNRRNLSVKLNQHQNWKYQKTVIMKGQPRKEGDSLLPRSPAQQLDLQVPTVKKEVNMLQGLPQPLT
jgi:hypothetical protein